MPSRRRPETPTVCDCPRVTHRHGTNRMYAIHACGCEACCKAHTQTMTRYRQGKAAHRVPVAETADRLRGYLAAGHTMAAIAEVATLNETHLWKIHRHAHPTVYSNVAALIRDAHQHLGDPSGKRVDATGTRRRLQALATRGWDSKAIADAIGVHRNVPQYTRSGQRTSCSPDTRRKVLEFYNTHWDKTPEADTLNLQQRRSRCINLAARNGWLPPLAWDDERIDDPDYQPNVTPIARKTRDEAAYDRLDDLAHLINAGVPAEEAAHRAGYPNAKAAYSAAHHQGLTHLSDALIDAVAVAARERKAAA